MRRFGGAGHCGQGLQLMQTALLLGALALPQVGKAADTPRLTGEEIAGLREAVLRCWTPPQPQAGSSAAVKVRFRLTPSGELDGTPQVVEAADGASGQVLGQSAIRAVQRCAPYSLPKAKYEAWREIVINFVHP